MASKSLCERKSEKDSSTDEMDIAVLNDMMDTSVCTTDDPVHLVVEAIKNKDFKSFQDIIEGLQPSQMVKLKLAYPAHLAVKENQLQILEYLLNRPEFHVDDVNEDGDTCLILACDKKKQDLAMVELLLSREPDLNAVRGDGGTALYLACRRRHLEVLERLVDKGAPINVPLGPLHEAVDMQWLAAVKILASRNKQLVNCRDRRGLTPLMVAAGPGNGNVGIVHALLTNKAAANARDREGCTALHHACRHGHGHIIHGLLEYGADVNARTGAGELPLPLALRCAHLDVVRELLMVEPNVQLLLMPTFNSELLTIAINHDHLRMVMMLLNLEVVITQAHLQTCLEQRRLIIFCMLWRRAQLALVNPQEIVALAMSRYRLHVGELHLFEVMFGRDMSTHVSLSCAAVATFLCANMPHLSLYWREAALRERCEGVVARLLHHAAAFRPESVCRLLAAARGSRARDGLLQLLLAHSRIEATFRLAVAAVVNSWTLALCFLPQCEDGPPNFALTLVCTSPSALCDHIPWFLSLFTLPPSQRQNINDILAAYAESMPSEQLRVAHLLNLVANQPTVGRLVELARDRVRRLLGPNLLSNLHELDVSEEIEDILTFQAPVYGSQ